MKTRLLSLAAGVSLTLLVFGPFGRSQDTTPPDLDQGVFDQLSVVSGDVPEATAALKSEDGVAVAQLKGAVHDAFAEAVTEPTPGPVVAKEPPADLSEMPPADKPEGEDIQWYGGYWEFDQDRADFTWISGIYRKPPPRRQWMAGHWVKVDGGWQRQRGVWMVLEITEITFIPTAPPEAPVEVAANTPPDDNSFFVPGHHEYVETSYVWKPGKWVPNYSNWVWIPAHWVWTPCGYVFVPGYWDWLLEVRGLLYAPVCVDLAYVKPGWTYTPSCVVHNTSLLDALFVRPGCGYFFGSYFQNKAYTCWPDHCVRGKICDPLFTHYKLHNKGKNNWEGGLRNLYSGRQSGRIASPPSNLKEFGQLVQNFKNKSIGSDQVRHNVLIGSAKKINTNVVRMQRLDNQGLQSQKRFSDQLRNAGKDLALKQTQHLQSNRRGGSSGGNGNGGNNVLKFGMDKSISSQFGNLNLNRGNRGGNGNSNNNNNGQSGNKNTGNKNTGILGGLQGKVSGGGQGNGGVNRNGNGLGNGIINRIGNNNGQSGNGGQNNGGQNNANKNSGNKNSGIGGNNGTPRILQGNGNGGTPKFNQGGSSGSGGSGGSNNGGGSIRRNSGSGNVSPFLQKSGSTGNNGSSNNAVRNFQQNNGGSSGFGSKSFQNSGSSNGGSSGFNTRSFQGSSGGSSGFSSKSFQGSSSGGSSFRSIGGSSGGSSGGRSFSGGSSGGRRGR